jgi:hypothetical protein
MAPVLRAALRTVSAACGAVLALVVYHATLAGLGLIPHSTAWRSAFVVAATWGFVTLWHFAPRLALRARGAQQPPDARTEAVASTTSGSLP